MDIIQALKEELQIGRNQVEAAGKAVDEGNHDPVHRALPQGGDRFSE